MKFKYYFQDKPYYVVDYQNDSIEINRYNMKIPDIFVPNKLITDKNKKQCNISHEDIQTNEKFMTCSQCLNNYVSEHLTKWLETNKSCPTCRSEWTDFTEYKNI